MTRSKILRFFYWLRDHLLFMIEVLVKLRIGREQKEKPTTYDHNVPFEEKGSDQERITNDK